MHNLESKEKYFSITGQTVDIKQLQISNTVLKFNEWKSFLDRLLLKKM